MAKSEYVVSGINASNYVVERTQYHSRSVFCKMDYAYRENYLYLSVNEKIDILPQNKNRCIITAYFGFLLLLEI